MLMKSISALITQVPHLPTHSNLTTTTFSAWTPLGENYLEYFKSQVVFSTCSLMAFYCTLSKSSILLLFEEACEPGEMEARYGLSPSWSTLPHPPGHDPEDTRPSLSCRLTLIPLNPPFPPLHTHFPSDWPAGRSLQGFIAPHSTSPQLAPLHCTALPHLH